MEVYWLPPMDRYILFCCDGASMGNPGNAGFGIIALSQDSQVVGTISGGLGITTNYIAEVMDVIWAIEWAVSLRFRKIIINSDSKSVINALKTGNVH
ncbi:hypothetical protein MKX01_028360, partial [Papaver californicum]